MRRGRARRRDSTARAAAAGAAHDRGPPSEPLRSWCGWFGRDEKALDALVGGSLDVGVRRLKRALERRGIVGLSCEVRFESEDGASCYGDLWCPAARALVEVDGFLTHAVRERFRADRRRDRWMVRDHATTTLRVDAAEVFDDLDALADELAEILHARIATG